MASTAHKCTNLGEGEYLYRGFRIVRRDEITPGYTGRFAVGSYNNPDFSSARFKNCKNWVDAQLDGKTKTA